MDVEKPKGLRIKRWQKKQLWIWRIGQRSESSRQAYAYYYKCLTRARLANRSSPAKKKLQRRVSLALSNLYRTQISYLKYCRRLQRFAKSGQLVKGQLYCKAGRKITQERIDQYEAMCHHMVRKFIPSLGLWEASFSYDDLINQCRMEIYLALLNGFNPFSVMDERDRTEKEVEEAVHKLEKTTVWNRLNSYLRRLTWKFHPDQLGGKTRCYQEMLETRENDGKPGREFRYGLFTKESGDVFPVDFIRDQQDRLLTILNREGPEAVKKAFLDLDRQSREMIQDSLFESSGSRWSELTNPGGMSHAAWGNCWALSGSGTH